MEKTQREREANWKMSKHALCQAAILYFKSEVDSHTNAVADKI